MDRVGDCELAKGLCLQSYQFFTTMVDSSADPSIFPPRMLHVRQIGQLAAHLLLAPSFTWQGRNALNTRSTRHKLALELEQSLGDLRLDLGTHAGEPQEDAVEVAADGDIEVTDRAEDAAALELIEGDARPSKEEQEEYNVAQSVGTPISPYALEATTRMHLHVHVQGHELALGGALPRIEGIP